jgi:hypothetical protein
MTEKSRFFEPLAELAAGGMSIRDAAKQIGASESRAYRLSSSTEFKKRVAEVQTQAMRLAAGKLSKNAGRACERLAELVESQDEAIAIRASTCLLDRFTTLSESIDLRARMAELEAKV